MSMVSFRRRPLVQRKTAPDGFDYYVANDKSGTHRSVEKAIETANAIGTSKTIFISNGLYQEKGILASVPLEIVGESRAGTIIEFSAAYLFSPMRGCLCFVAPGNSVIRNLTIKTNFTSQSEAEGYCLLMDIETKLCARECDLLPSYDSRLGGFRGHEIERCRIEGAPWYESKGIYLIGDGARAVDSSIRILNGAPWSVFHASKESSFSGCYFHMSYLDQDSFDMATADDGARISRCTFDRQKLVTQKCSDLKVVGKNTAIVIAGNDFRKNTIANAVVLGWNAIAPTKNFNSYSDGVDP